MSVNKRWRQHERAPRPVSEPAALVCSTLITSACAVLYANVWMVDGEGGGGNESLCIATKFFVPKTMIYVEVVGGLMAVCDK